MKNEEKEINRIVSNLKERELIVREVNFKEDIDIDKSYQARYDIKNSYLEFLYSFCMVGNEINKSLVLGNCTEKEGEISLIPTLNKEYKDQEKRASLIFNSSIGSFVDIVAVKFLLSNEFVNFYYMLCNNSFYDYITDKSDQKIMKYPEDNYQLVSHFNHKSFVVKERKGSEYVDSTPVFNSINKGENNTFILDLRKRMVKANNKKWRNYSISENLQKYYLYLAAVGEGKVTINELEFGNEKGYIYLKPFEVEASSIKMNIIYKGEVQIEYFNKEGKWEIIHLNETISLTSRLLNIRFLMKTRSKVFYFNISKRNK